MTIIQNDFVHMAGAAAFSGAILNSQLPAWQAAMAAAKEKSASNEAEETPAEEPASEEVAAEAEAETGENLLSYTV